MNDFGERLKDLRVQNDMTQEDVASKLFVTKQAVSRWENGNCLPDVATLGKLAEIFDVNIDYLLIGNDNVKIEKEIEIVEKEKIVEVEKEKIVEVEKPLSDEEIERILDRYKHIKLKMWLNIFSIIAFAIAFIVWCTFKSWGAIVPGICFLAFIPASIYSYRLYKKEKKTVDNYLEDNE